MKKLFLLLILLFFGSTGFTQTKKPELIGTWKKITKTSALKLSTAEYILLTDDSIYVQGVDSIGNSLAGESSGRWSTKGDSSLILYPSDRIADTRYFKLSGENRYTFEPAKKNNPKKPSSPSLTEIYLEKCEKKD